MSNSYTECFGSPGIMTTPRPIANQFPWHRCDHTSRTSLLNVPLIRWLCGSLMYLAYSLSMDVCTTGHWHTSGRLVQELNVCIVTYIYTNTKSLTIVRTVMIFISYSKCLGRPGTLNDCMLSCPSETWA